MKRNWKNGLFRIVIVFFFVVMLVYELVTTEGLLKSYFSWNNGFIFGLKIIIIPAALIYMVVWAINWCRIGFKEPKLNINWEEGGNRLAVIISALLVISFFIWVWVETEDLVKAFFLTVILSTPFILLYGALDWIGRGFKKSKDKKYHDEYDE